MIYINDYRSPGGSLPRNAAADYRALLGRQAVVTLVSGRRFKGVVTRDSAQLLTLTRRCPSCGRRTSIDLVKRFIVSVV